MNKKTRIGLTILLAMILVLTMTVPGMAKKPDSVKITVTITEGDFSVWPRIGSGTFKAVQAIKDEGPVNAQWSWAPNGGYVQSTITLLGQEGEIVIYMVSEFPEEGDQCVDGSWRIVDGTGTYENLRGVGEVEVCGENPGEPIPFTVQFDGMVH